MIRRDKFHKISPGVAFGLGHLLPALGILQELLAFPRGHIVEPLESGHVFVLLWLWPFFNRIENLLRFLAFGFGQRLERFVFLIVGQLKVMLKGRKYLLALRSWQCLPSR